MIKKNKWTLIFSSLVILLPTLFGIFADKLLPEKAVIHWNIFGEPDAWGSTRILFTVLPLVLLAVHWLCILISFKLDKSAEQNQKIMKIMFWILPLITLSSCATVLMTTFGHELNIFAFVMLILGVMFVVIGNYTPKITRSRTAGIKIKWTYSSEENWNATHRFSGKVLVLVGILCFVAMPLPEAVLPFVLIFILLATILPPVIYSYRFYKKQLADGSVTKEGADKAFCEYTGIKNKKVLTAIIIISTAVLIVLFAFIMFTGDVTATLDDTSLTVDSTFWTETTIKYEDITAIDYRENGVDGERLGGYGSARLLLGNFSNSEFGGYTRYTYTGDRPCIVITRGKAVLVIGLEDEYATRELYVALNEKIAK